jgi:hypothetical protein
MVFPQVLLSGMLCKLCLDVHFGSTGALTAPEFEISGFQKRNFTENLLHYTATFTQKNENRRYHRVYPVSFWIKFKKV